MTNIVNPFFDLPNKNPRTAHVFSVPHNPSHIAVVNLAKQNGYVPPRSKIRKPVKLQKNIVSMLTETLDASREYLKNCQ